MEPSAGRAGRRRADDQISVRLPRQPGLRADALEGFIRLRSVDRNTYSTTPLTDQQKAELANALGPDLKLSWFDSRQQRWSFSRLNGLATDIRLRCREAYDVHRRMLDWDNRFSPGGLPATAIGLDSMTRKLMRWAMTGLVAGGKDEPDGNGSGQLPDRHPAGAQLRRALYGDMAQPARPGADPGRSAARRRAPSALLADRDEAGLGPSAGAGADRLRDPRLDRRALHAISRSSWRRRKNWRWKSAG